MFNIVNTIWTVLESSVLNVHTYVGLVVGAMFAPFWMAIYNYAKSLFLKKVPGAAPVVSEVEGAVDAVKAQIDPVVNAIENSPAVKDAQPKS